MGEKKDMPIANPEQLAYASVLEKGMLFGLVILLITFFIYCFSVVQPYIPFEALPKYWSMNVHSYLEHAKAPHGWGWLL